MAVSDKENTKARLLEAAGEEFAEKGYEAASIRQICERVGANCAAVNYHFGSKEQLYIEAVFEAHRCGTEMLPESVFQHEPPAEQLRQFIRHFLSKVVAISDDHGWHHMLMMREMVRPTKASEVLVKEAIRPKFERLLGIMRGVCPRADECKLHALAFSVIGQCLHYRVSRAISSRLAGPEIYQALDLDYLAGHITSFSLAALGLAPPLSAAGAPAPAPIVSAH